MPLPPPPALGFSSTGKPTLRTIASTVSGSSLASPPPGTTGTRAASMSAFARALSPRVAIVSGFGPTKVSPAAATAAANLLFSDRNP